MFLTPYNEGFRYTGTGDFNKWDTYSVAFDGTDDYVVTPYVIGAISTFTISCWAKGTMAGSRVLVSDLGSDGSNKGSRLGLMFDEKTIYVNMGDGTNFYYAIRAQTYDATSTLFDGDWHHVVVTIDTEIQKFYIDGALVHTHDTTDAGTRTGGTSAVLGTAGTYPLTIGRWGEYHGGYWSGGIDEVAIWESVLSAAQVLAIYNGGTPQSLASYSPIAWWRMGDGPLDGNGLIGDQMNLTLGSELVLDNPYEAARWAAGSTNTETFVAGESVRIDRPASGGDVAGGYAYLTKEDFINGILSEALVADTTYKVTFTLDSDDSNVGGDIIGSDWAGHTYSTTGAGVKTMYLHYVAGNPYLTFFNLSNSKYLKVSNLSVKKVNGYAGGMINMTASDIAGDTP